MSPSDATLIQTGCLDFFSVNSVKTSFPRKKNTLSCRLSILVAPPSTQMGF